MLDWTYSVFLLSLNLCPFILKLENKTQCSPVTLASSCFHVSVSLWRCRDGPRASKATWMCCSTCANRLLLTFSWAGLTAWAQIKLLCMHSSLGIFLCQNWQCRCPQCMSQPVTAMPRNPVLEERLTTCWVLYGWKPTCVRPQTTEPGGTEEKMRPQQTLRKKRGRMRTAVNRS